ncbi:uncharacterized protein LOC135961122 [Calliphora vicina]|uniref:uncharacterized protein LOC135961122 n=1 Tax=Calliphora vicina TaxID=7373 RepID=UPI00325BDED1
MEKSIKEQQQMPNNEMLSGQPCSGESRQNVENSISPITTNSVETDLKLTQLKEATKPTTCVKSIMEPSISKPNLTSQNKQRPKTALNHNSSGSKSFRNPQSARSPTSTNWKSPFSSFITTGIRSRLHHPQQSSEFAYDLSRDELKFAGRFRGPMKPAPDAERQLLKNGQRREYLTQRYEHSPVVKYNYPEATSWRIGWLQQQR